jgi:hypothetical protein
MTGYKTDERLLLLLRPGAQRMSSSFRLLFVT